jgi:hypothetical protein
MMMMMGVVQDFPRSEIWRLRWAGGTCISVFIVAVVALFSNDSFLSRSNLVFSSFITGWE